MKPIIAVTMGDPAGIGPEIFLRMAADATVAAECVPAIYGDAGVLRRVAGRLGLPMPARVFGRGPAGVGAIDAPCVVDCDAVPADAVTPGRIDAASGGASFAYIEAAIADALAGRVAAVATAPVHKEALHAAGVPFPGHTEIFAAKTDARRACMMLTSDELTCGFVTTHVGYHEVPGLLSRERIRDVIELAADAVSRLRGRPPRLVVCGPSPTPRPPPTSPAARPKSTTTPCPPARPTSSRRCSPVRGARHRSARLPRPAPRKSPAPRCWSAAAPRPGPAGGAASAPRPACRCSRSRPPAAPTPSPTPCPAAARRCWPWARRRGRPASARASCCRA
jgi:hypothetical protein